MKPKDKKTIYYTDMDDAVFMNALQRRRNEAEKFYNKTDLKKAREQNLKEYLSKYIDEQLIDERYQEIYSDNRQFVSVRTILPFLTARVTAPEVTPADGKDSSIQFAHDFEEGLQRHAEREKARMKVRLAVQDVLKGQRIGYLKWVYNAQRDTVELKYIKPDKIVMGTRGTLYDEPDFISETIEMSINDLCTMFQDKQAQIYELFGIDKGVLSQLEKVYEIKEEWLWIDANDGTKDLIVGWSYQNFLFGKIKDPNWDDENDNLIDTHMVPYVFFNLLNNGSSRIDETSYMEQAHWSQVNYNKRGQTIAENAKYGGTGVPIFAKDAIAQKDVAKIRFSPIQRVLLNATDVRQAFTVWQSTPLPNYIIQSQEDLRDSIDNVWGANATLRGQETDNKTLGQDVINRDQAEGRLSDPVDCVDDSMTRFYNIEAQMIFRYWTEKKYINFIGNDGVFVSVGLSNKEVADNIGVQISVKAGTSLPIDRAQRRATIMQLLQINKVGTLTAYKELGIFDDPEAAYKDWLLEQVDPATALEEVDKQVFDREAFQDLMTVIAGQVPEEREDITPEYGNYLNEWLLTDKYMVLQQKDDKAAARVSQFVDAITAKLARKMNKLAMQPGALSGGLPVPPQVQAAVAAQSGQQPQNGAPTAPPPPTPTPADTPLPQVNQPVQ